MAFIPKKSKTESLQRDEASIEFVEALLREKPVKPYLSKNDKTANIDGYIELLDADNTVIGKLTVQVKTVSPCNEGKFSYPCPTSLFGYAERVRSEIVLLIAVDHQNRIALWKHISCNLIESYTNKDNQETITLNFDENERMSVQTVDKTIEKWRAISTRVLLTYEKAERTEDENEQLRHFIMANNRPLSLSKDSISEIQTFIGEYNRLLDNEFAYLKSTMFQRYWMNGFAFSSYEDNCLEYGLYDIDYGEDLPLIKRIDQKEFRTLRNSNFISFNCADNEIKANPRLAVIKLVEKLMEKFIKQQRIIPADNYFLSEYIRDFCRQNRTILKIADEELNDISTLLVKLRHSFKELPDMPYILSHGHKEIRLNNLYDALDILRERGFSSVFATYPERNTHAAEIVSDFYNPHDAREKMNMILNVVSVVFSNFINTNFPIISPELDFFKGADTLLVEMDYEKGNMPAIFYYGLKHVDCPHLKKIECATSNTHPLLKENNVSNVVDMLKSREVKFCGERCELKYLGMYDSHKLLFDKYNLLATFYEVLKDRMETFFAKEKTKCKGL